MTVTLSIRELEEKFEGATRDERMDAIHKMLPNLTITLRPNGVKTREGAGRYQNYTVKINNGKEVFETEYGDSVYNYNKGISADVFDVIYCVVSDATAYEYNEYFEDFYSAFGYDNDSRTAERIHKACEETYDRLVNMFGEEGYTVLKGVTYGY